MKFCAHAISTCIEGTFEGVAEVISSVGAVVNYMQSVGDQSGLARRGHPRIAIDSYQLCHLMECVFRVRDVALIIHCSKRTIERQMNELHTFMSGNYSTITEKEVDCKSANFLSIHRLCGEKNNFWLIAK